MKKIRHILLFIVAVAMMVSMSAACLPVSAGSGSTSTETEWSLGANAFEIGAAGSTALLTKGPFMIDLVGKQLSATVVDVNGVASIQTTEGKTAFAKSASGIIDLAPAEGDARVTFTAPADGTYAFAISVEKTDMPAYAEGSKVKNWTQIGAVTSSGAGFGGWNDIVGTDTQGYAGKGITNESGWGGNSGVNTVLSKSAAVKLTAGQCITVSVSKEGDCDNTHTTLKTFSVFKVEDGVIWSMGDEFKLGEAGSDALLANGPFGLDLKGKSLSTTVVNNGGVESIVSTDDTPIRAFTKSANGIIDLTPAVNATSQVYFKAPVDGTYWFSIQAVKADMSGVAGGETVKNWTEIGPKASLAAGYNSTSDFRNGQNYTGKAIGNTNDFPQKEIAIANTATLKAGEVITISINAQGTSNETQTTLTQFDVLKLPASVTTDTFASSIGTPEELGTVTANNFTLGSINSVTNDLEGTSFRPVDATKLVPAWTGAAAPWYAWSVFVNEADRPIFGTSQTGSSMDMMPKNAVPSVITYTAPETGVYLYDAIVKRSSGSPDKSIAVIVGTGNASGAYVGELEKTEIAANQTLLVNGTVELKKGDTIWFVANNYDAAVSAEIGVNKLEVTRVGDHVCREWNNDGNCTTKATCNFCGEKTGPTDANNHELSTFTYTDNEDGATHTKKNACCSATVAAAEAHNYNGDAVCDGCGYTCPHAVAEALRDCKTAPTCAICNVTLEKKADKHASGEFTYVANADGTTHTKKNACCGATVAAAEAHAFDATGKCTVGDCAYQCPHTAAEALRDCKTASTCAICNVTLEKKADKHVLTTFTYESNNENTHTKKHACCNVVADATEAHNFNGDNKCDQCGFECTHTEAEALRDCKTAPTCDVCKVTLEKKADKHVLDTFTYEANDDGKTHTKKNACCGATVADDEAHGFDATGKCTVGDCAYQCPHTAAEALRDCKTAPTCEICNVTLEKKADKHVLTSFIHKPDAGDETHTKYHECCEKPVAGSTMPHDLHNAEGKCGDCGYVCQHPDANEATCQAASVCPDCGNTVADKDMTKHVLPNDTYYAPNDDTTHILKYRCCNNNVDGAVNENHENGTDEICDKCYYGCNHDGQGFDEDDVCKDCGFKCYHDEAEMLRNCQTGAECTVCGKQLEKNDKVHIAGATTSYKDTGFGTHVKKYDCCQAEVSGTTVGHKYGDDKDGKCDDCGATCKHPNETPDCQTAPICSICEKQLEKDMDNHTSDETYFVDNGENHTEKHSCCDTEIETSNHDWSKNDGVCVDCEAECDHTGEYTYTDNEDGTHTKTNKCCGLVADADEAHDWSKNDGKCVACGSVCDHTGEYTYTDNEDGTHTKINKCCGLVADEDEAHDWSKNDGKCAACGSVCDHTGEYTYTDNEDGTHTKINKCCGLVADEDEKHSWTDGKCANCAYACDHKGAPAADCKNAAVCATCGKTVADKDASKHVGTTVVVDNENGTHTEKYECCGAVVKADAKHTYTNGTCACGAKKPSSKPSSPNTSDTAMSVAVALVAIAGVGIFALNSKKRRQK